MGGNRVVATRDRRGLAQLDAAVMPTLLKTVASRCLNWLRLMDKPAHRRRVGAPGSQRFELYQLTPFDVVASGQTGQPNSVPEPATGALVMLALGGIMLARARSADRANRQL